MVRRGRRQPLPSQAGDATVLVTSASGSPGSWNSAMYQECSACVLRVMDFSSAVRVRRGQGDQAADALGVPRGERPRDGAAPVVPDDVGALDAGGVEQRQDVGDQLLEDVVATRPAAGRPGE